MGERVLRDLEKIGVDAQFVMQAAMGGLYGRFFGVGMATTSVGPQAGEVVFFCRASLEKHASITIVNEDGKGPVQTSAVLVRAKLALRPDGSVVFINKDDFFHGDHPGTSGFGTSRRSASHL